MDWETCMTMNGTWGYNEHDHDWKSSETIIRTLIDITSKGGNYLLNIGPTGDGSIPQPSIDIMKAVGKWMNTNVEAIRGTSKSPLGIPNFDGRITAKGKVHYLHLFSRPASGTIAVTRYAARMSDFPTIRRSFRTSGPLVPTTTESQSSMNHLASFVSSLLALVNVHAAEIHVSPKGDEGDPDAVKTG